MIQQNYFQICISKILESSKSFFQCTNFILKFKLENTFLIDAELE